MASGSRLDTDPSGDGHIATSLENGVIHVGGPDFWYGRWKRRSAMTDFTQIYVRLRNEGVDAATRKGDPST